MRQALYALVAAIFGFAAAIFLLPSLQKESPQSGAAIDTLAAQVDRLTVHVERLAQTVDSLPPPPVATQLAPSAVLPQIDTDLYGLDDRVAALESRQRNQSLQMIADGYPLRAQESEPRVGNPIGEALFAAEPEVENRHYQAVVSQVFAGLPDQPGLRDVACRGSICRVSYEASAQGVESAASHSDALISALLQGFQVKRLQLHHGRDEAGNSIAYIRIP